MPRPSGVAPNCPDGRAALEDEQDDPLYLLQRNAVCNTTRWDIMNALVFSAHFSHPSMMSGVEVF
jgi:hypothetical protein